MNVAISWQKKKICWYQFTCFFDSQVGAILSIEHAVGVSWARADTELVAFEPRTVRINIVELRTGAIPAGNHGAHRKTVAFVRVNIASQDFAGTGNLKNQQLESTKMTKKNGSK